MFFVRRRLLAGLVGLISLSAVARVQAGMLYEPNNTTSTATAVVGSLTVSASLDPVMPQTIVGEFDPTYGTLLQTGPSASGGGNQWIGVPVNSDGSVYFRVSGIGDVNFSGDHTQSGQFSYVLTEYDATHNNVLQMTSGTATLSPKFIVPPSNGSVKNVWLNPLPSPPLSGATADLIVTDLVSKGDVDFYTFSGLQPGQSFTANINATGFQPRIAVWTNLTTRGTTVDGSVLSGHADSSGHVLIGVTGQGDTNFTAAQISPGQYASGNYSLTVTPVPAPEPAGIVLLALGGMTAFLFRQCRRGRRPPFHSTPAESIAG